MATPLNHVGEAPLMRYLLTSYLTVVGIVAGLGAVVSITGLPAAYAEFAREPEDLSLRLFWAFLCFIVFGYCVAGGARGFRNRMFVMGPLGYAGSAIVFFLGLLILLGAALSTRDRFLILPALMVLLCPFVYLGLRRCV
jgi:hypothetical protein